MAAARNTNLADENNRTKASSLVDEVIYISDDKVEDLSLDTAEEDETRTDKTIKNEREKINNKDNSSLE